MNKYDKCSICFFLLECVSALSCGADNKVVRMAGLGICGISMIMFLVLRYKSWLFDTRTFTNLRCEEIRRRRLQHEKIFREYVNDFINRVIPDTEIKRN